MIFNRPEFLYALSLLAIPIIIHLFNFRRYKTVHFSQVKFLKNIKQKTQSTSRLKHILVLISRCLAISFLVIAFSEPIIPMTEDKAFEERPHVCIYIDNSFSMDAEGSEGALIQQAIKQAISIVDAYDETDQFQIISNNFLGRHNRWYNKENIINEITSIEPTAKVRKLSQVMERISELETDNSANKSIYLISDLQKSSFNLQEVNDTNNLHLIALQSNFTHNAYLNQLQFKRPYHLSDQTENIQYTLRYSEDNPNTEFIGNLYINDKLRSPINFKISDTDSSLQEISYQNKNETQVRGSISIKDFPIAFDDTLYYNYPIQSKIEVLHIHGETPSNAISRLFANDSLIAYQANNFERIDFSNLFDFGLIILDQVPNISTGLNQELNKFIDKGRSIAVFPNNSEDISSLNNFLTTLNAGTYSKEKKGKKKVANINLESDLFDQVFDQKPDRLDLPEVYLYRSLNLPLNALNESVLEFKDEEAFLVNFKINSSKVYLFSSGLSEDESNFANHALFVPLLYNMAIQSRPNPKTYHFIGDEVIIIDDIEAEESAIHLVGNGLDIIPSQRFINNQLQLSIGDDIQKAGHYELTRDGKVLANLSLNYNRDESILEFYTLEELEEIASNANLNLNVIEGRNEILSNSIKSIDQGLSLWKLFIVLGLLFFGIEILLLRLLK